jgi:peptidoglycan/xylan/chitin deacetylase (PgdA/CDA1 family)
MPYASLSLDLDNQWSYMKTHGDAGWQSYPSYLDAVVPRILEFLAARRLTITFFIVGQDAALPKNRAALAAIAAAGHEIGNHTYTHRRMVLVSDGTVRDEIERTDAEIRRTGYQGPITFRPPYGKKLYGLPKYLADHDRTTVTWDVEPDSAGGVDRDTVRDTTLAQTRPGSIVLLHVMHGAESAAALRGIVTGLREQGYHFATVSELLARN